MSLPLPTTLTPSKLGRFVSCPLSFRYHYIDHLPEPPTSYLLRGTLLHRALQVLYADHHGEERTVDRATTALEQAWEEMRTSAEFAQLELDEPATESFVKEARSLLGRYLTLEDPTSIKPVGVELDLRAQLGNVELRGIIDRLDWLEDGSFVLVDYKTGRSPRPEQARTRMTGVLFYAYLCERALGLRPREIRLIYLKDQVVVVESPSDQSMRGIAQRSLAVWGAIERACESEDFRPNPSALCRSCAFQSKCPACPTRPSELALSD